MQEVILYSTFVTVNCLSNGLFDHKKKSCRKLNSKKELYEYIFGMSTTCICQYFIKCQMFIGINF